MSQKAARQQSTDTQSAVFHPYVPMTNSLIKNKRKRDEHEQEEKPGLQEFMHTMQAGGSKPTWSNEDHISKSEVKLIQDDTRPSANDGGLVQKSGKKKSKLKKHEEKSADQTLQADDSETVNELKKKNKRLEEGNNRVDDTKPRLEIDDSNEKKKINKKRRKEEKTAEEAKGGVETPDDEAFGSNEDGADRPQPCETRSDNDWLRAKTSRLLDLVTDDENRRLGHLETVPNASESSSTASEDVDEAKVQATPAEPEQDEVLTNGRLFVRNLPYGASETEVEKFFSKSGKVSEVSLKCFLFYPPFMMISDRDSLCNAHDLNRTEYFSRCFSLLNLTFSTIPANIVEYTGTDGVQGACRTRHENIN